jgi:hypothetical protein
MLKGLFKFFASLKLAVFTLLLLSAVLAYATIVGSYYGMRGSQIVVYQRWWFGGVLFLLGLNVFCAAMIRYPWKSKQTGFVLTHLGIIVLLVGSFVTQQFGIDGNLPVPEKKQSGEVILNNLKIVLTDQKTGKSQEFHVPESHVTTEGKILEIDLGEGQSLVAEKFIPRAIAESRMVESPLKGVGVPALKIGLSNDRFQIEEWIKAGTQGKAAELNLGPAIVSFEKLSSPSEEKAFFKKTVPTDKPKVTDKGQLLVEYRGERYALRIADLLGKWRNIGEAGLEIQVERYLPYAVVEGKRLVSKNNEPINPAVEVVLRDKTVGTKLEKHTVFALFPEFNTLHKGKNKEEQSLGVTLSMQAPQEMENLRGVGKSRGRLFLAQTSDDSRLLYRVLAAAGSVNSQGELSPGKKVATGWMNIELEAKEWLKASVMDEEPRSVDTIQGADEPYLSAVRLRKNNGSSFWLLEGMGKAISAGSSDLLVYYQRDKLNLPFQLYLDKFTMGTNPGTNTAASFISNVTVKDPKENKDHTAVISMNEPLKYGGYYFYQASYQLAPGQPPVSVFAVNFDPGRILKYLGSLIMTLGIGLMFYMNPQYWKTLVGSHKE